MKHRTNTLNLAKKLYGRAEQQCQVIHHSFQTAQHEITDLITLFLANHLASNAKANPDDVQRLKEQLQNNVDDDNQVVAKTALQNNPMKTNLDVLKAGIVLDMLKTARLQHQALNHILNHIGNDVAHHIQHSQKDLTKLRPVPPDFNRILQKQIGHAMSKWNPQASVNKNTLRSIRKIHQIAQRAVSTGERPINYKQQVQKVLTGDAHSHGASGTAQNIIRTETCRAGTQAKLAAFRLQNVKVYEFYSLEARNTCADCRDLDGTSFKVSEAQEGVNCPPIHSSCRCWVEAVTDYDDFNLDDDSDSLFTDLGDDDDLDEDEDL